MSTFFLIKYTYDNKDKEFFIECDKNINILDKLSQLIQEQNYKIYHISIVTCHGCINSISNQEGHMNLGGCLYQENFSS